MPCRHSANTTTVIVYGDVAARRLLIAYRSKDTEKGCDSSKWIRPPCTRSTRSKPSKPASSAPSTPRTGPNSRPPLADDIEVDHTALHGHQATGASNYVTLLQEDYDGTVTVHDAHMPEIELTAADSAVGTWAMQVLLVRPDGQRVLAFGHHQDTYGLQEGRWLITTTTSTRLQVDES